MTRNYILYLVENLTFDCNLMKIYCYNQRLRPAMMLVTITALIFVLLLYLLPKDSFWITDGGNKLIVTENIARHGTTSLSYPAINIDPDLRFFPDSHFHFHKYGSHVYSVFPGYFPWLSSFPYRIFGASGLYLIPLISSLIVLCGCVILLKQLRFPPLFLFSLPLLAFATPFFFYTLTFWEMTLGAVFSTAAVLLLLQRRYPTPLELCISGILLGCGVIFREELYFLIAAVTIALLRNSLRTKNICYFGIGCVIIIIPLWGFQYWQYGHILGIHGSSYQSHNMTATTPMHLILERLNGYFVYLFKFNAWNFDTHWLYYVLLLPFPALIVAGVCYRRFRDGLNVKLALFAITTTSYLIFNVMLWLNPQPIFSTIFTVGLIPASPLLLPLLANIRPMLYSKNFRIVFLILVSLIYLLLLCPALTQSDMGIIWGPRHFLFLFPWLIPLSLFAAAKMFPRKRFHKRFFFCLLLMLTALSLSIQARGITNLFIMKNNSRKLINAVSEHTDDVIVSDVFWLVTQTAPLYFRRRHMQFKNYRQLEAILRLLKTRKIRRFSLIFAESPAYHTLKNDEKRALLKRVVIVQPPHVVKLPGTKFLNIIILNCRQTSE